MWGHFSVVCDREKNRGVSVCVCSATHVHWGCVPPCEPDLTPCLDPLQTWIKEVEERRKDEEEEGEGGVK